MPANIKVSHQMNGLLIMLYFYGLKHMCINLTDATYITFKNLNLRQSEICILPYKKKKKPLQHRKKEKGDTTSKLVESFSTFCSKECFIC